MFKLQFHSGKIIHKRLFSTVIQNASTIIFGKSFYVYPIHGIISANKFENSSYDHVAICNNNSKIHIELEMTYCFWKNNFTCDIIGEKGSAHIESLCKWGPSIFTHRKRIFPSGIPKEKKDLIKQKDPTWEKEHKYFKKLVNSKKRTNLSKDLWIFFHLSRISNTPSK